MPLSGLVPVQSSHRYRQLQQANIIQQKQTNSIDSPKRPGSRQEIWIDGYENNSPSSNKADVNKKYGYMDEHKANMINNWVEKQTVDEGETSNIQKNGNVFLTQFKQVESDESNTCEKQQKHQVIVHQESNEKYYESNEKHYGVHERQAKIPPPPPPRRTPPRDSAVSSSVNSVSQNQMIPMIDDAEIITVEESIDKKVSTSEISCQVTENDLGSQKNDNSQHPLRILSEENLTIVSSFAGSLNELPNSDDEQVDASKLSFFQVPDFGAFENENDRIQQTFKDFEELQNSKNNAATSSHLNLNYEDPRFKQSQTSSMQENDSKLLHTFSSNKNKTETHFEHPQIEPTTKSSELITPQKQFLLLSQSLRHPDGSSNPELNTIEKVNTQLPKQSNQLPLAPQRSPGNGRSSSDLESENNNQNEQLPCQLTNHQQQSAVATSPNNNSVIELLPSEEPLNTTADSKSKSRFSFKFLRLFGSTRSKKSNNARNERRAKSVDRKLENSQVQNLVSSEAISAVRSSSSSPMVQQKAPLPSNNGQNISMASQPQSGITEDPSMLSISTEWEFEPTDEANGNNNSSASSSNTPFDHILIKKKPNFIMNKNASKDRKSSGYDSLGGDESSSLDSTTNELKQPIRLSREMNNSLAKAFFSTNQTKKSLNHNDVMLIHNPEIQPQYSMPNDYYGQSIANTLSNDSSNGGSLNIMQYDELDIIRMDQRQKPPI